MKYKKSLLTILIVCVLFSISSVMASDTNETTIAIGDDSQIIEETDDEIISASVEEKVLATDDGTFTTQLNTTEKNGNADIKNQIVEYNETEINTLRTYDLTEDIRSNDYLSSDEKITPDLKFYGLYTGFLTINLPTDATGNVILNINSQNYSSDIISDGVAEIVMPELENGNYTYNITYSGDEKYRSVSQTGILKLGQNLTAIFEFPYAHWSEDMGYSIYLGGIQKEYNNFTVILKTEDGVAIDSKKVTVKIYGATYTAKSDSEGKAAFKIHKLEKGIYSATIKISGDNHLKECSTTVKVIVLSSLDFNINAVNETPADNNESIIEITCRSGLQADSLAVLVDNDCRYLNDIKYKNEDDDAQVYIKLQDLEINKTGEYDIVIKHISYTINGAKEIELKSYKLIVGKMNLDENETNTTQQPTTPIKPSQNPTTPIKPSQNPTTPIKPSQNPTTPVKKTTLILKSVKVKKSAKQLVLQATLKQGKTLLKGKMIVFKFNGKTYKAKTNKKGIAKVTIKKAILKKLKVGKKVKYQASYGKITVKKSVKVKK